MNQQQLLFAWGQYDPSKINNEYALIAAILLGVFISVPQIKNTIYQYSVLGGSFILCGAILYSHFCDTSINAVAKNEADQKVCAERTNNLENENKKCGTEKDTLKYCLDATKKQKEGLDKDLIVKNEKIKALKSENKKLFAQVKEQEGQYNFAYKEGYCVVVKDGKYGFKDKHNHIVIPYQFLSAAGFSNERAGVKGKNQKWGYVDYSGTVVIPYRFDDVKRFEKDGLAIVTENGKQYKIDKGGRRKKTLPDVKTSEIAMK